MSWTTPPTFVSGAVLDAADLNIGSDDLAYLFDKIGGTTFTGVSLVRATSQSISTATYTLLSWSSATLDVGGWWASGTDITVPAGAIPSGFTTIALRIDAVCRFNANATGNRQLIVIQNGTGVAIQTASAINGETTTVSAFAVISAAAGDVIQIQAYQSSGSTLGTADMQAAVVRLGGNT